MAALPELASEFSTLGIDDYLHLNRGLADAEDAFDLVPLDVVDPLLLDDDGRTSEGLRYTWEALGQTCRLLCNGLYRTITDLCGRHATIGAEASDYDVSDAAVIFNRLLRRRFWTRLSGKRYIRDITNAQLQAIVGRSYKRLSNLQFFEMVENCVASCPGHWAPHAVSLIGRRLSLRYRREDPLTSVDHPVIGAVHLGIYFANTEVGNASLRGGLGLVMGHGWAATAPLRVAHAGTRFEGRVRRLFLKIAEKAQNTGLTREYVSGRLAAIDRNLGFRGLGDAGSADDVRFSRVADNLRQGPFVQSLARRVLRRALYAGGAEDFEGSSVISARADTWPSRTGMDLLAALVEEGSLLPEGLSVREAAERLAFSYLTGKYDPLAGLEAS